MEGGEIPLKDKLIFRKRAVIETANDELRNIYQI
ncbi:MAG: Transposase domain [Bacteroidetes bacterium]|nr:Transposase domain [Bacteroidota bacterium]